MGIALVATFALVVDLATSDAVNAGGSLSIGLLLVAVVIGASIGLWRARIVEMTGMPELIALLHSFVGLAAVLVGWNGHLEGSHESMNSLVTSTRPRSRSASSSARSPSPARSSPT